MSFGLRLYFDFVVFVLGAAAGSFFNVCIYRMPREESIVNPPSHCPKCNERIRWHDNIPLVSFLVLRGKCRHCGAPISPRYLFIELLTASLFLAVWLKYEFSWLAPVYWILVGGLIVSTFIDFEHYIIPNEITFGGIVVGLLVSMIYPPLMRVESHLSALGQSVWGMVTGGLILFSVVEAGKKVFGKRVFPLPPGSRITIRYKETEVTEHPKKSRSWMQIAAFRVRRKMRVAFPNWRSFRRCSRLIYRFMWPVFPPIAAYAMEFNLPSTKERPALYKTGIWIRRQFRSVFPRCWGLRLRLRRALWPVVISPKSQEEMRWEEIFSRSSDRIVFHGASLCLKGKPLENVEISVSEKTLEMQGEQHELSCVAPVEVVAGSIVIPREAMGMGDAKFIAGIGAFLGWQAALFTIFASSLIGGVVGLLLLVTGKRAWGNRLPYGPYIALAALLWIFFGREFLNWYFSSLTG